MNKEFLYENLTKNIIKCFYIVHDELADGFLESVYEIALLIEFRKKNLKAENQKLLNVNYKNQLIGEFKADIVVEDKVIIEIKACNSLAPQHEAQLIHYLRASGIRIGLLVNFGEKLEFKRRIV